MSWYSAQILFCFIAYLFHFFYSSVGLVGNFAGLPICTVPSAIVQCNQNEAGHQTIKAPSMPCWGAAGPSNTLWHLCHRLVKLTDKWMKSVSMGSFQYKNWVSGESFAYLWVILLYFSLESRPDSSSVGISQVVLKINKVKNLTGVTWLSNWSLKVFYKQFSIKIVKYEDGMLILGQNDIFCCHNVFSVISSTDSFQILGC